jgi:hypothetical protein
MPTNTTGLAEPEPQCDARGFCSRLRAAIASSVLVAACFGVTAPAFAVSTFDGDWSVVISTQGGACPPSFRFGVQIDNGRVIDNSGSGAAVDGRVAPNGAVSVSVRSGDQWANGNGRLGATSGSGVWRGAGSSGACGGTWVAERRGGPAVAAPSYNYGQQYSYAPQQYYYAQPAPQQYYSAPPQYSYVPQQYYYGPQQYGYGPRY